MNLSAILEKTARDYPDKVALVFEMRSISNLASGASVLFEGQEMRYRELNGKVNRLGNALKDHRIGRDDKVGLMLPNRPEFVIAYFATLRIGACVVPLNIMSTPYELRNLLGNCEAKALITNPFFAPRFERAREGLPACKTLICTGDFPGSLSFQKLLEDYPERLGITETEDDDPAAIIYTSGLTGKPLGAVLTHCNLSANAKETCMLTGYSNSDRGISVIPFFHTFGAMVDMISMIMSGGSLVLFERYDPEKFLKAVENYGVTVIVGVPTLFSVLRHNPMATKASFKSIRLCICGGASLPVDLLKEFERKFKVELREGYGLTEASPVCTFNRLGGARKVGSIGLPFPDVDIRIFDERDRELPVGEVGELVCRGPNVMKGYYKDEAATHEVMRGGWLHTGDLARKDADGYIYICGRKKRMVITSGFNVYSKEVESVLNMHPSIRESAIVGKPDPVRGEVVKALVVRKHGREASAKEIIGFCREYLSAYKVPKIVKFVENLPR